MIYPIRVISHLGYKFLDKGKYGEYHPGIDLNSAAGNDDLGEPILAPAKGVITMVHQNCEAWGNHFHLKCETLLGIRWFHFSHCQTILVQADRQVSEGEVIAKVGNSGGDWTSHLHFECKKKATGVDFYPNKSTTKTFILNHYEDPLVFIDTINNLNQQNDDVKGLKEIVGTQANQIREMNKEIEGFEIQVKGFNNFMDNIWEKLSPITIGEKNETTILAEIEKLIYDEDQLTKAVGDLKKATEHNDGYLTKLTGLLNASSVSEENVVFEIQRLQTNLSKVNIKIEKLSKKVERLEEVNELDNASNMTLLVKLITNLFKRKGVKK